MTSVLLLQTPAPGAPDLAADFAAAGFSIHGTGDCAHLVRETLRAAPDVLVCWAPRPTPELLGAVATLQAQQAVPVLVFTQDAGVELLQQALEAGVHAWVVQGYAPQRLRPLVHLAQARAARELQQRKQLAELAERLEERKWVDKAKGILMQARQVSEEEAFQLLRTASMQANRKVGQLSRQVIDAARTAQAINRAGQQRMLSQRLVKLYALSCSRTEHAAAGVLIQESVRRIDGNLAALAAELSQPTYGDLLAAAQAGWQAFRAAVQGEPAVAELARVDALGEAVVAQAEALVRALESSGIAPQLGVVNRAGRQRWLSQRMAKLVLLQSLAGEAQASREALAATQSAFERNLEALAQAPLSTPAIRALMEQGRGAWAALCDAIPQAGTQGGRVRLAGASEELLEVFDRLTEGYQHSMEVLMGS